MSRALAIANTLDHFDSGAFLQTLSRRVAFRTESQKPAVSTCCMPTSTRR